MNESNTSATPAPETSLGQDVLALLRHWLGGRRRLLALGLVAAGGLWLGWPTLVAAGIAPLLLAVLPCAAMCALGLCMKGGGQSRHSKTDDSGATSVSRDTSKTKP